MSRGGIRAGVAIFLIGLLFIWLVRPIGNPCPDVEKLPSGSSGSSAPSFAPPLTRTCTYSTPEGTQARKRYVPVLDLVALLFVSAVVGGAIGLAGPGRREARPRRAPRPGRAPRPRRPPRPGRAPAAPGAVGDATQSDRDAAERERARQEREARRRA